MVATLTNKFAKKTAPATTGAKKSIYAGIQANVPREPIPDKGTYTLKVLDTVEGNNPGKGTVSFKTRFEIVEIHDGGANMKVGAVVVVPFVTEGSKAAPQNRSRVKAQVMACAGFDDETEYDAFDPDGLFIEACKGDSNPRSEEVATTYNDRLVLCQVERGKATPDGADYYREYAWATIDEQ